MRAIILSALSVGFAALLAAAPAAAETAAARLKTEAQRLLIEVNAARTAAAGRQMARPAALPAALSGDLQRFGMDASRLALDIAARGGPADLGCIFRGMGGETDTQLTAIARAATGTAQASALARLSHMLEDAAAIAPAAQKVLATPKANAADPGESAASATCPAVKP